MIYCYNELDNPDIQEITDDEIIKEYWNYWCEQMLKVKKGHLISRQNCIEDWVVINWAWEKTN